MDMKRRQTVAAMALGTLVVLAGGRIPLGRAESAGQPVIYYAELRKNNGELYVDADINLTLNPRLEDALMKGVALYFTLEFNISKPRWYWLDADVVGKKNTFRIYYHAITRSFRMTVSNLHHSFATLEEALNTMAHIRNWSVGSAGRLDTGTRYVAELRFKLDTSLMPKPFQVTATTNSDWHLESDWLRWEFTQENPEE